MKVDIYIMMLACMDQGVEIVGHAAQRWRRKMSRPMLNFCDVVVCTETLISHKTEQDHEETYLCFS